MTTTTDRILGCLYGVHCGDALGAAWEFKPPDVVAGFNPGGVRLFAGGGAFDWPVGAATDDTEQTILVARALLTSDPAFDLSGSLVHWLKSKPPDVGTTTLRGLRNLQRLGYAGTDGFYGNGSLMRTAPVGCVTSSPELADKIGRELSAVTHSDALCVDACGVYSAIVCALVAGDDVPRALATGSEMCERRQTRDALHTGSKFSVDKQPPASGHVIDSLRLAVSALVQVTVLAGGTPAVSVLSDVVLCGYDTDTNAAIAGGLIGAHLGNVWPDEWLDALQRGVTIKQCAYDLATVRERETSRG